MPLSRYTVSSVRSAAENLVGTPWASQRAPDSMAQLAQGKKLLPTSYSLITVAKFECGDVRYSWLNDVIAVGVGEQVGFSPTYTFFEVG